MNVVEPTKTGWILQILSIEASRFRTRLTILRFGLYSALFWLSALTIGAWLSHWDLAVIAWILLLAWILVSIPALYVQMLVIVDLFNFVWTGRIVHFQRIMRMARARQKTRDEPTPPSLPAITDERTQPRRVRIRRALRPLLRLAGDTSPLVCFATWAMIVLYRTPSSAIVDRGTAQRAHQTRRAAEEEWVAVVMRSKTADYEAIRKDDDVSTRGVRGTSG